MHILQPILKDWSAEPSTGEGMGSTERPSDHVQECNSKEEIHDQAMEEAERMKLKSRKKERRMTTQGLWLRSGSQGMRVRIPRMKTRRRKRRIHRRMKKHRRRMMMVIARNHAE